MCESRTIEQLYNELYGMIYGGRVLDALELIRETKGSAPQKAYAVAALGQDSGFGLLCAAALSPGSIEVVKELLELGASPNCACFGADHVLSVIMMRHSSGGPSNIPEFEEILKWGGDVSSPATGPGSMPLLHFAIVNRKNVFVDMLLRHGADPSRADDGGITALDIARRELNFIALDLMTKHAGAGRM